MKHEGHNRDNMRDDRELVVIPKDNKHTEAGPNLPHVWITDMISHDLFSTQKGVKVAIVQGADQNQTALLEVGQGLMDDLTADVLDIILLHWTENAKNIDDEIHFHSDDALNLSGFKGRSKNGDGDEISRRSEMRNEIMKRVAALDTLRMISDIDQHTYDTGSFFYESLIEMRDRRLGLHNGEPVGLYSCKLRPTKFVAEYLIESKQVTSFLVRKTLEFDPFFEKYEKRMTRYLSWWWRIHLSPYIEPSVERPHAIGGVHGLYQIVGLHKSSLAPVAIKDRFETLLDNLVDHAIIKQWHYIFEIPNTDMKGPHWFEEYWLKQMVIIEPTDHLAGMYGEDQITVAEK